MKKPVKRIAAKSTGKHQHAHCKHKRLEYCESCQKPYCLDCAQEWQMPMTWAYYPTLYGNSTTIGDGSSITAASATHTGMHVAH